MQQYPNKNSKCQARAKTLDNTWPQAGTGLYLGFFVLYLLGKIWPT